VEHSGAAMDNAYHLLTVVMGPDTVLMAVMRLDVVRNHSGWAVVFIVLHMLVEKVIDD